MPTIEVRPDSEELLQQVADSVLKSRKIIVVTGAGISTNSGIPDFRSENGLYSLIQAQFDAASKLALAQRGEAANDTASGDETDSPPAKRRRLAYDDHCVAHESFDGSPQVATESQAKNGCLDSTSRVEEQLPVSIEGDNEGAKLPSNTQKQGRSPLQHPPFDLRLPITTSISGRESSGQSASVAHTNSRRRSASADPLRHAEAKLSMAKSSRARSVSPPRPWRDCTSQRPSWAAPITDRPLPTPQRRTGLSLGSSPPSSPPRSGARPTPLSARLRASLRTPSRFAMGSMGLNSSPLSSPPPILFDPFQESSSSTSQQGSSEAGSTASSETDDTPPSSVPSLMSQTSNPTRASLPNLKGRDLFDVSIWSDPIRTSVFYTFTTTLRQKARDVEPTTSHHFISHLKSRGKLVRCYTQNIDQIEEKVGLSTSLHKGPGSRGRFSRKSTGGFAAATDGPDGKTATSREQGNGGVECVFLHGSLQSLRCFLCGQVCEWDECGRSLETLSGRQPECPHCVGATNARQERGKRALGVGKLRPDIVLYGEEHPNAHLIDPLVKHDLALYPDFLLILGTSLKVHGLKVIVREFAKTVHCKGGKVVFVNFTKPPESSWGDIIDYWIQWDCDAWVTDLQGRIPLLWLPPGTKLPTAKRKRDSTGSDAAKKRPSTIKQESTLASEDLMVSKADSTITEKPPPRPKAKKAIEKPDDVKPSGDASLAKTELPSKGPVRPMSTREDKVNGAYLTWQIARDLRRLSGNSSKLKLLSTPRRDLPTYSMPSAIPPPSQSTPCTPVPQSKQHRPTRKSLPIARKIAKRETEISKPSRNSLPALLPRSLPPVLPQPKAKNPRKTGRGWVYVTEDDPQARAVQLRQEKNMGLSLDSVATDDQSILSAVKSNPRRRKRKMIDGVEVGLPSTPQRPAPAAKQPALKTPASGRSKPLPPANTALPQPTDQAIIPQTTSQNKKNHGILSPKILSDLNRPSMHSLILPPIRPPPYPLNAQNVSPAKLAPLEPLSPPAGPFFNIAPNVNAPLQHHPFRDMAFRYEDLLRNHFSPPWTPDDQLRQEQAAMALNGLRSSTR